MLAKLTAKNQLTLPKAATAAVGATEYFDVRTHRGAIVLTPVRIQRADAVRAKLAEMNLTPRNIDEALDWARAAASIKERAKHDPPKARTRRSKAVRGKRIQRKP